MGQFGLLDSLQRVLNREDSRLAVRILGVNEAGQESGNGYISRSVVLPWLQDTAGQDVWGRWHVTWRDVVVLDDRNHKVSVYNLTVHDLRRSAAYDSLAEILRAAAK